MGARRWFHILLGAVFLPVVSLPFEWAAALRCWTRPGDADDRRWARRALGLAAVDTVLAGALVAALVTGRQLDRTPPAPPPRVVIGVTPDVAFRGPGLRLTVVAPGGPAAAAGVRVGDVLRTVDAEPVVSLDSLRKLVADRGPGAVLALGLVRDGAPITLRVTTVWSTQLQAPRRALFQPEPEGKCSSTWPERWPWPETLEVGGLAALALLAMRSRSGAGLWFTALAILGSLAGTLVVSEGTCRLLGGPSLGGAELAVFGTSIGLGATALLGIAIVKPPEATATRTVRSTVLLGFWYAFPGALRLIVLIATLCAFLPWPTPFQSPVTGLAQAVGGTEGPGFLLLALGAIVLAPIGEELTFRGLLLPSLSGWVGFSGAIWISATVFGALHWYYGVMIPVTIFQGLVLGWARVVSGGLRAPILLHAGFNLVPMLLLAPRVIRAG